MPKKINNYKIPDEIFIETVKQSRSIREALLKLGLTETGSAYRVFKRRIASLGLDTSHLLGMGYLKGKTHNWTPAKPLAEVLIEHSDYDCTYRLKHRLFKERLLKNECYSCGLKDTWQGSPISLQLDHINGIRHDNRLCNLRILCPNCHSQTSTFAGRSKKKN